MKRHLLSLLLVAGLALPVIATCAAEPPAAATAAALYRCPMHPHIHSDHPGKCTICGMALVATAPNASVSASDSRLASTIGLSRSQITAIGIATSTVSRQPLVRTLRVNGRIEDNDTSHRILAARVPGRVEKLGINYVGAEVAAGAVLATIYSPEMLTAQRVYLERLKAGTAAYSAAELAGARESLQMLGLTAADLAQLEEKRVPSAVVVIRAPGAGTVVSKSVYEGQYVTTSDRLFEIADFSSMWFMFDAYEQDISWLHVGQQIEITTRAVPGEVIHTKVEFIDPNFSEATRTTRVRATLPNPHYSVDGAPHRLPHRVLAEGRVLIESPAVLAAPRSAVLDSGLGPVAYVAGADGRYEQRLLTLGRRGDSLVEVLSGLQENDTVVTTGALLLDAQAQLAREAAPASRPASNSAPVAPSAAGTATPSALATPPSAPALSPQLSALGSLATAALDAADALGSDDFARYQKIFPAVSAASAAFPALPKLERGDSLKTARRSFEPWSTAVADLLKPHRAELAIKIFQCPMAPVLGKGRWVQRSQPLKNPFFGAAMLECGDELP